MFWIELDAEDEPTVWTGNPECPTPVLRRCEIAGDDETRDGIMSRIVPSWVGMHDAAWTSAHP